MAMQASESIEKPPAICLMGPTAAGKTQFAMDLADRFSSTLINVDSAQVYRGMDIGTGKPDATTRRRYPHRLMDIRDPSEIYSASQFRADAIQEMSDALVRGKTPVLVGGTMLYFKVLRDGLAAMPNGNPRVRKQIETLAAESGWETVHAELKKWILNPLPGFMLMTLSGCSAPRGISSHWKITVGSAPENHDPAELPCRLYFVAIQPTDRAVLHNRIAERFRRMLSEGLIEEVRALYERGDLNLSMSSMKSVGYRQVWQYLAGEFTHGEMIEKSIVATRQLAKRQLTWLRGWPALRPLGEPDKNSIDAVLKILETAAP